MGLPDLGSTQAITKFLRTSNDLGNVFELIEQLLSQDSVLPNKQLFIIQLLESRLNSETNVTSQGAKNGNKNKLKSSFHKEPQAWKALHIIVDQVLDRQIAESQRLLIIQSIRSLKLFPLLLLVLKTGQKNLIAECVSVLRLLLKNNMLNIGKSATQSPLSILSLYLTVMKTLISNISSTSEEFLDWFQFLVQLYEFLVYNESIIVNFNNRDLVAVKSHQIKEIVKFHKENSQFIVNNFVDNDLLNSLLSLYIQAPRKFKHAKELIEMFLQNSISFSVDAVDAMNLLDLNTHFVCYLRKHYSQENVMLLYKLLLQHVSSEAQGSAKNFEKLHEINESIINHILGDDKNTISINELIDANLESIKDTKNKINFSSEFISSLCENQLKLAGLKHLSLQEVSDEELLDINIGRNLKKVNFDLLLSLLDIENHYVRKSGKVVEKYGLSVLIIYIKGVEIYNFAVEKFNQLVEKVFGHFFVTSHSLLQLLEIYKKLHFVSDASVLDFSERFLAAKLNILSISQLNKVFTSVVENINHHSNERILNSHFAMLNSILFYLINNLFNPVLVANNKILLSSFYDLIKHHEKYKKAKLYFKSVYQCSILYTYYDLKGVESDLVSLVAGEVDFNNYYHVLLIYRYIENYPEKAESLNIQSLFSRFSSQFSKLPVPLRRKYLSVMFGRYFNLFTRVDKATVKSLTKLLLDEDSKEVFANQLIFESPVFSQVLLECLSQNHDKKAIDILGKVPIECYSKAQRVGLVNLLYNSFIKSFDISTGVVLKKLLAQPTFKSNVEVNPEYIFALFNEFVTQSKNIEFSSFFELFKLSEEIALLVLDPHFKQHQDKQSKAYLDTLVESIISAISSEKINGAMVAAGVVFKGISDFYSYEEQMTSLKHQLQKAYTTALLSNTNEKLTPLVMYLIANGIFNLQISTVNLLSSSPRFDDVFQKQEGNPEYVALKIALFSITPSLYLDVLSCKFGVYYITLFVTICEEINSSGYSIVHPDLIMEEQVGNSSNTLQLGLYRYLNNLAKSEFIFLYSFVLHSLQKTNSGLLMLRLLSVFIKVLKTKKVEYEQVNKKKLLADTISSIMLLLDNNHNWSASETNLCIAIFSFILSEVNFTLSQYSFEQLLCLVEKLSLQCCKSLNDTSYSSITKLLSKILLVYRYRLTGRYHLLVNIYLSLLTAIITAPVNKQNYTTVYNCSKQFTRSIGNLCQPNDQSAKTVSKQKNDLNFNVNIIKKDLRFHLPNIILHFIKLSLNNNTNAKIEELLVHDAIFIVFDVITEKELTYINSSLDASGRTYFKTIFEDYNKFGKWKE